MEEEVVCCVMYSPSFIFLLGIGEVAGKYGVCGAPFSSYLLHSCHFKSPPDSPTEARIISLTGH